MCGRYVLYGPQSRLTEYFDLRDCAAWAPRYNIAPQSDILVIRQRPELGRVGQSVRWGVSGGICLGESAIAWDVEWIDVHLVFAWKGSRYVQEHDLRIPKRVFRKENGLFYADFFLDLYPVFEERQGEVPRIPQGLHVTAVCASQFFGPYPLDMSPFAVSGR